MTSDAVTSAESSFSSAFLGGERNQENTLNTLMVLQFKNLESSTFTAHQSSLSPASYQGASYPAPSLGIEKTRHHNEAFSIQFHAIATGAYRAWIQPFGLFSHQNPNSNHPGIKQKSAGLLVGIDKKLSPTGLMGVLVGNSLDDYTLKKHLRPRKN